MSSPTNKAVLLDARFQDISVSDWLAYQFQHFDDFLFFIEKGRITGGETILQKSKREIEVAIELVKAKLGMRGVFHLAFAPEADRDAEKLRNLYKEHTYLVGEIALLKEKLYGIKSGRHTLNNMEKYIGQRNSQDYVVGYEIFLEEQKSRSLSPMHKGFLYAVSRRLHWEKRKAETEILNRWNLISKDRIT